MVRNTGEKTGGVGGGGGGGFQDDRNMRYK